MFNNYSLSPNGSVSWAIDSEAFRGHEGERNNCFYRIQLVGQKYRDKTTLASKIRFSSNCFGFQSRRISLQVGYNIQPSSRSTNQNAALIIDHYFDFTKQIQPGLKAKPWLIILINKIIKSCNTKRGKLKRNGS